jgi:hypothetical protein
MTALGIGHYDHHHRRQSRHRWLTHYFPSLEILMKNPRSAAALTSSQKFQWTPSVILSLLALGVLGYIAVVPAYLAAPDMNEASWFVLTDQAIGPDTAMDASDSQDDGVAAADARIEPVARRSFSFFPGRHVKPATKLDDPLATF